MSHTVFLEILSSFLCKFPPAQSLSFASLKLTTKEIASMISEFHPGVEFSPEELFAALKDHGYHYEPIEENERVVFFWLLGQPKVSESF